MIGEKMGKKYHTANIRSVDEARQVYKVAKKLITEAAVSQQWID